MKVFGVMIANGFSSEVSAGSRMLGNAPGVRTRFAVHSAPGNNDAAAKVESNLKSDVITFDMGWRSNADGLRPRWAKAASWAKLSLVIPKLIARARAFQPDVIYSSQQ